MAARHGVEAFVADAAARARLELPASTTQALRRVGLIGLATVLGIDAELDRLIRAFGGKGVPTIVLKGPALARTIYARRALRPYGDIDLTFQERHHEVALRTLIEHGYVERPYAAEDARRKRAGHICGGAGFHRMFESADRRVLVEVHTDPLQLGLRPTCEAARWRRAVPVPGLPAASMLGPEDQVVQLSTHVHKHGFERLIWLKDLDALLRVHQGRLDWSLVESVAGAEGVRPSVWYSLLLTQLLLDAPVPVAQLNRLRPSLPIRLLYGRVWPAARIIDLEGFMRRRAVQFHAAESWRGVLPSLVLMGRRAERARVALQALGHLSWRRPNLRTP
jgi:hypothetical protein